MRQKPHSAASRKPHKGKKPSRAPSKGRKHPILPLPSSLEETGSDVGASFRFIREHRDRVKQDARLELEKEKLRLEIAALKRAESSPSVEGRTVVSASEGELTDQEKRGKHCAEVVAEIKQIKSECTVRGKTVAEMRRDYPHLDVWQVVEKLPAEDQETFQHPTRWGTPAGYARSLLATFYARSAATIKDWVKRHNRTLKSRTPPRSR